MFFFSLILTNYDYRVTLALKKMFWKSLSFTCQILVSAYYSLKLRFIRISVYLVYIAIPQDKRRVQQIHLYSRSRFYRKWCNLVIRPEDATSPNGSKNAKLEVFTGRWIFTGWNFWTQKTVIEAKFTINNTRLRIVMNHFH